MQPLATFRLALMMPGFAAAQTIAVEPIRIVAGATAGCGVDTSARTVVQGLQEITEWARIAAADITAN